MRSYYKRLSAILFLSFLFTSFSACIDVPFSNPDGLIVILKADDLGEMTPNWSRFMKIVEDDTICAGIGVISKNVKTEAARQNIRLTSTLKQPNNFPVIEFWNHGFDHSSFKGSTEFGGTGNVEQLNHMHLAQKFFTDTLKLTSHCFGAPFNRTTNVTH